jgi:hypothetical protein
MKICSTTAVFHMTGWRGGEGGGERERTKPTGAHTLLETFSIFIEVY